MQQKNGLLKYISIEPYVACPACYLDGGGTADHWVRKHPRAQVFEDPLIHLIYPIAGTIPPFPPNLGSLSLS